MDKNNLDFSVPAYWAAFIVSTILYIAYRIGMFHASKGTEIVLSLLLAFIIHITYVWYKRSKVTTNVHINGEDILSAVFASFFSQWGVAVVLIFFMFFNPGHHQNKDASNYYENCTDARYHNAAPLYEDDAGYRDELDRDGDGVACE
ncbi:excalibur calcium-binding domain-containing protein [Neobacillus niacini]|uniref:excalibur calcium-binding domain-containing protein n=1 Tax=Neobacillus niacini TaxID=86668 RepID=UPI0028615091|nr:excalibur calcium-binding domain-containing protein [Neobacillus niacini]MDR6999679.1 hypothetical protein [Neobacillus niacini]